MNYRFEHGIIIIHASNPKLALILNYTHYDVLYEERRMRAYYFFPCFEHPSFNIIE
jgi:hypothetical protein